RPGVQAMLLDPALDLVVAVGRGFFLVLGHAMTPGFRGGYAMIVLYAWPILLGIGEDAMTPQEIEEFLIRTRDAGRLSRHERQALAAGFAASPRDDIRELARHPAFELARAKLERPE